MEMNRHSRTLTALLQRAAEQFPERKALVVPGRHQLTHAQLQSAVNACAARLRGAGLRSGDVAALCFPNTIEFVVLFMAVLRAGGVAAPLNPAFTDAEFEFYLGDSESKLLLVPAEGNPAAEAAAGRLRLPVAGTHFRREALEFLPKRGPGFEADDDGRAERDIIQSAGDDVAIFLHTSGTTSRPKGVALSQSNVAASAEHIRNTYELSPSDATLVVLPLFHVHGLVAALLSSLAAGGAAILPAAGRFSASAFWSDMRAHGATWYTAVPTIHQILLARHDAEPELRGGGYPKLRFVRSCSASLAPAVLERLEAAFGAPVLEAYAMTEAAHQVTSNPLPSRGARKAGSVGKPTGVELAVLDDAGALLKSGCTGEVCIRGPNLTRGYHNRPDANKSAFRFGWFHTGDLGFLDADGYLFLIGRMKELINRGGEKISPSEVDAVLLAHPAVAEAVAFAVPDDKYGEEINAAVVPAEIASVSADEIIMACKKKLAPFKIPKKIFLTNALPKTATGKIQRGVVSEHFAAAHRPNK